MYQAEKLVLLNGTGLFGLGVLLASLNPEYFHDVYSTEDGVLEWVTVLALTTTAVVTAKRLWLGFGRFSKRQKVVLFCLVLLATFGAGEELSWGQRLFDTNVPGFFMIHNAQGETNIHNLVVAGANVNKLVFAKGMLIAFLLYLGVLTPLYHRSASIRSLTDAWAIPIPKSYQIVGYVCVIVTVEGLLNILPFEVTRRGELTEFAVPLLVALNVVYPLNYSVFEARNLPNFTKVPPEFHPK